MSCSPGYWSHFKFVTGRNLKMFPFNLFKRPCHAMLNYFDVNWQTDLTVCVEGYWNSWSFVIQCLQMTDQLKWTIIIFDIYQLGAFQVQLYGYHYLASCPWTTVAMLLPWITFLFVWIWADIVPTLWQRSGKSIILLVQIPDMDSAMFE